MKTRIITMFLIAEASQLCFGQFVVPEGTKVRCRLEQTLSSATAEEGQPVQLSVTEDVKVNDTVVIPQGATVSGAIVQAVPRRRMGRTGKLDFSVDRVRAVDGNMVPLRYSVQKKEGGSHGVRTGIITAGAAVVFWPAAPVFLLMKGKDVTINKGVTFDVFTDQNHVVQKPTPVSAAPAEKPAASAAAVAVTNEAPGATESAVLTITSESAGAEIELDGVFVGSTPTTLHVRPGTHRIVVKNGADIWQRDLQVLAASSISVAANFRKK